MSNYATITDLRSATGIDTSDFAKKTNLANLKSDVDKLNIGKSKNVRSSLSNWKSEVDKLHIGNYKLLRLISVN